MCVVYEIPGKQPLVERLVMHLCFKFFINKDILLWSVYTELINKNPSKIPSIMNTITAYLQKGVTVQSIIPLLYLILRYGDF